MLGLQPFTSALRELTIVSIATTLLAASLPGQTVLAQSALQPPTRKDDSIATTPEYPGTTTEPTITQRPVGAATIVGDESLMIDTLTVDTSAGLIEQEAKVSQLQATREFYEQLSIQRALEIRDSKADDIEMSKRALEMSLEAAFDAKQQLLKAELSLFQVRLRLAEQQIRSQVENREKVVDDRLEELMQLPLEKLKRSSTGNFAGGSVFPEAQLAATPKTHDALRLQLMEMEVQMAQAKSRYGSNHPKIAELKTQLETLRSYKQAMNRKQAAQQEQAAKQQQQTEKTVAAVREKAMSFLQGTRTRVAMDSISIRELADLQRKVVKAAKRYELLINNRNRDSLLDDELRSLEDDLAAYRISVRLYERLVRSRVDKTKINLELQGAKRQAIRMRVERMAALYKKGAASQTELVKEQTELQVAEANLASATADSRYFASLVDEIAEIKDRIPKPRDDASASASKDVNREETDPAGEEKASQFNSGSK